MRKPNRLPTYANTHDDNQTECFGSDNDVCLSWDGTNFIFDPLAGETLTFSFAAAGNTITGSVSTGDDLTLKANTTDDESYIKLLGDNDINMNVAAGDHVCVRNGTTKYWELGNTASKHTTTATTTTAFDFSMETVTSGTGVLVEGGASLTGDLVQLKTAADTGSTALKLDVNGNSEGLVIDSEADAQNSLYVDAMNDATGASDVNDYATVIKNSDIGGALYVTRNVTGASKPLVYLLQNHATDTQDALYIKNDGTGYGLHINQVGDEEAIIIEGQNTTNHVFSIGMSTLTTGRLINVANSLDTWSGDGIFVHGSGANNTANIARFRQDGAGNNLVLDKNNSGYVAHIDQDVNNASNCIGLYFDITNAGAGLECAMQFSASIERAAGTETTTKYVRVLDSAGNEYYIKIYSVA